MRIACIHAHPDDAEILAGGTLALLANAGHQLVLVTMTAGDCGSAEYGAEELTGIRKSEAAGAAALIDAEYLCANFWDLAIFSDDPSRRRVTQLLREIQPELILTASPDDYHCDHEATSQLRTRRLFCGVYAKLCSARKRRSTSRNPAPLFHGSDRDGRASGQAESCPTSQLM